MSRLSVAIDGPSGSGKSTLARGLAEALGCAYVDTGLMYRAVALRALRTLTPFGDEEALTHLARDIQFDITGSPPSLLIDGARPERELHSTAVDSIVSAISAFPTVRAVLVERQRSLAHRGCVVMAGRDIGTTVLPDATLKLWITASEDVRAGRRFAERGVAVPEVADALSERDRLDSQRAASPLRKPADAVTIDTGDRTPDQTLDEACRAVAAVLARLQSCTCDGR